MSDLTVKRLVCDNCNNELMTVSSYPAKYSLELKAINTNVNNTGAQYAVKVFPPISDTKHFCNLKCLTEWCNNSNKLIKKGE